MKNFISPTYKHNNLGMLAIGTILALIVSSQIITQAILLPASRKHPGSQVGESTAGLSQKITQTSRVHPSQVGHFGRITAGD